MDPYVKDLVDVIAKVGGLFAVIGGIIGLLAQLRRSSDDRRRADELRREDLRWRKSALARQVVNELLEDALAVDAMKMLDYDGLKFEWKGAVHEVATTEMTAALRIKDDNFDDKEVFVRDAFDSLFGHLQLLEHYRRTGLVEDEDIAYPIEYYAERLDTHRDVVETYLRTYRYVYALALLRRLWSAGKQSGNKT